ncbi:MAG: cytochrome c peroxidase [Chitinophagaceae bacterium]
MKRKLHMLVILSCIICSFSYFTSQSPTPKEKITAYYVAQFKELQFKLEALRTAIATDKDTTSIRQSFFEARLAYKKIELILEYYFEGDAIKFNGLAINFIEEEDPMAFQEPQGFQVIESFLFPEYNRQKKDELLQYINKLIIITNGLANNSQLFEPEDYMPDAMMEELYRIISLGITGFDSPLAIYSLPEASAALNSVQAMAEAYKTIWQPSQPGLYSKTIQLIIQAKQFINQHNDFNSFNRMVFIKSYLNPLCDAIGAIKAKEHYPENKARYTLIKKNGSLFNYNSLNPGIYFYDDTVNLARIALGKQLFYEPLLSTTGKRSCASCHQPAKAFTDGLPKALQLDEHSTLPRNTPTLWNASLQMNLFYDSRHVKLEDVVLEVLANEKEMNKGATAAISKLSLSANYKKSFGDAYPGSVGAITETQVAQSIAAYIKTLISYNSRFDKFMRGNKNAMNAIEVNGFNLFMGKAKCATCHYAPLFNGSKPPTYYYQESEVIGVPATVDTIHPVLDSDSGRVHTLNLPFFNHAFKTPTLRNIALTAPYMHNGVYKTLEEVINFYDKGGGQGLGLNIPNQTLPADKLQLSPFEKKALKAFLLTLTDTSGTAQRTY